MQKLSSIENHSLPCLHAHLPVISTNVAYHGQGRNFTDSSSVLLQVSANTDNQYYISSPEQVSQVESE